MDGLSAEESAVVALVHEFVDREVKPVVRELEHTNTYPDKLIDQMKQLGIFGLAIPEPWGEAQVSAQCYSAVTEELARGWMSLAGAMGGHTVVAKLLLTFGTDEQKDTWLPPDGDRRGPGDDGPDRARGRLGPAGDADHGPPRGRPVRRQRVQDLDHQRPPVAARRPAVQDRPGCRARAQGRQHPPRRARPRVHRQPGPAQARLQGRGELRADL